MYIGNDDLAGPDGNAHPQVVKLTYLEPDGVTTGLCTGWLSSSNTITTAGHCIRARKNSAQNTNWAVVPVAGSPAQQTALRLLGTPVQVLEHPVHTQLRREADECHGVDVGVLVFAAANAVPRTL